MDFKVPYTKIISIHQHQNADRLEICQVYGFNVVAQKGKYKIGDKIIFVPIDSVLPSNLENILFTPDSKIKLHKSRVKQIRIRGFASQGMLIDPKEIESLVSLDGVNEETDLSAILGIVKYEPQQPGFAQTIGKDKQRNKKQDHPLFHKYNGLDSIKWFPNLFNEGEEVVVQEKLHGTNARASLLPYQKNTLWKKFKVWLGIAPAYEKCYGSNNVEISSKSSYKGFYGEDIYGAAFKKINVFDKIKAGETVFGEIIGPSIQKNYDYGLKERTFVLFDVKILNDDLTQTWLSPEEVEQYAKERGFEFVPVLYKGPYNKDFIYSLTKGDSVYNPKQKIREGIVIKAKNNYSIEGNKKALKYISEDYLDKDNSDFH